MKNEIEDIKNEFKVELELYTFDSESYKAIRRMEARVLNKLESQSKEGQERDAELRLAVERITELTSLLKEEAIAIFDWMDDHYEDMKDVYSFEELAEEYLKDKQK